jgi:hypothetical protein
MSAFKQFACAALLSFGLLACKNDPPPPTPPAPPPAPIDTLSPTERLRLDLKSKIQSELGTAVKQLDLVAGFQFGMNAQQVERHTEKMAGRQVLRKVKKGKGKLEFVYQMPTKDKNSKIDAYLDAEYHAGGLYRMPCRINTPKGNSGADYIQEIAGFFNEWYGKYSFELPDYNGCKRYVWISGNRHIELRCESSHLSFVYTDLSVANVPDFDQDPTQVVFKEVKKKSK